jgi:translation initiation factor 5A
LSIKKGIVKSLKSGNYFTIDDEPCQIIRIEISKPGKHGPPKATIEARGLFDGRKRNVIIPADRMVDVPVIDKRMASVIAEMGDTLSLMDSETYDTFEIARPVDDEVASKIAMNVQVEYWSLMDRLIIIRVKND